MSNRNVTLIAVLAGVPLVLAFLCCGGLMLFGFMGAASSVRESAAALRASQAVNLEGKPVPGQFTDPSNQSRDVRPLRKEAAAYFTIELDGIDGSIILATIRPDRTSQWHRDPALRKNLAGLLYAFNFDDDKGRVEIYEGKTQVATYTWKDNWPQFTDLTTR